MKKILKGTIVLTAFAFSVFLFQMSCTDDVVAKVADYILPAATTTTLGGVIADGTTILVDANGKISSTGIQSVSPATPTSLGVVKPDGTSITVDGNGVISAKKSGFEQIGKIIYIKIIDNGVDDEWGEIWTANYDGTSKSKINITLPAGSTIEVGSSVQVSPDGKRLFFPVQNASDVYSIYSCNLDGSDVIKVIEDGPSVELGTVY